MVKQDEFSYASIRYIIANLKHDLEQANEDITRFYYLFKIEFDTFLYHTMSLPIMNDVLLFYFSKSFTNQIFKGPFGSVYRFDNLTQSYQKLELKSDITGPTSSTMFEYINQREVLYIDNKEVLPITMKTSLNILFQVLKLAARQKDTIKAYIFHLHSSLFTTDSKYIPQLSNGEIVYNNHVLQVIRKDNITSLNHIPRNKCYYDFQLNDKFYPIFKTDFAQQDIDDVKEYFKSLFPFQEVQQKLFIKTLIKLIQCGLFYKKVKYIAYLYGPSDSGKTSFCDLLKAAFGNYVHNQQSGILQSELNLNNPQPALYSALQARIVIEPEIRREVLQRSIINPLLGEKNFSVRTLYQGMTEIPLPSLFLITSNFLFQIDDETATTYSKFIIIPFLHVFPKKQIEKYSTSSFINAFAYYILNFDKNNLFDIQSKELDDMLISLGLYNFLAQLNFPSYMFNSFKASSNSKINLNELVLDDVLYKMIRKFTNKINYSKYNDRHLQNTIY